ncbi:long-chain fatty acid--CoA ligase [Alkalihalobacterium sp. APHAB7]|uniref:long-chain fatty acid--CoA ligase n=1 Tax=Alkalihalobacterium sp. APHAB7 TaxID=3402081 RepID=UPI003AAF9F02
MMNVPLTISSMLERAENFFPKKGVVSRTLSKTHRLNYKEIGERTRRLASSLERLGIKEGDKVATFAWNQHRHLETYFAVPSLGAVLHMVNIRLSEEHISYIINHANDRILLIDEDLLPIIESVKDELKTVEAFILMTDQEELPETTLEPLYSYEDLINQGDKDFQFRKDIDENTPAGMCYTSATTGNPKGVLYSHRALTLHSMMLGMADTLALSESDVCMPLVPMFHVNAWGLPYASAWYGTQLVLPGPNFTPEVITELIENEKVTITAGVPTIWLGVLNLLEKEKREMSSLRAVICGGSAAPMSMIKKYEEDYGIPFMHAYGMTETTPIVALSRIKSYQQELSNEEKLEIRSKQGLFVPGVEMKIVNEQGPVEWDGKDMGELLLRGNWIADSYFEDDRTIDTFKDGWLHTGDIATIDEEGTLKLVDRTKDLIKSGGEWISSVDLENALMAHEGVFEAAVVAVPSEKWLERPVACVVLKPEYKDKVTEKDIIEFLTPKFAKWWLPDKVLFIDEIPKTTVGKFLKRELRSQLEEKMSVS